MRKGIILAGGTGSRLFPITNSVSKQLIPLYDKPMIYYPLTTLMLAGIRDILIITNQRDRDSFEFLLKDGKQLGINIDYIIQPYPEGIAQSFILAEDFIGNFPVALILGDNLFHANDLCKRLKKNSKIQKGASIFGYSVKDPAKYGVIDFSKDGKICSIEEKPTKPLSNWVVTGLYFYDSSVVQKAKSIKPSERGELEITDINKLYLKEESLRVERLGRGVTWLDTGTFDSLYEANSFVRTIQYSQSLKIGCPEEVAWRNGWIKDNDLIKTGKSISKSGYGDYLLNLVRSTN